MAKEEGKEKEAKRKGKGARKAVAPSAAAALLREPERAGKAEAALQLLHAAVAAEGGAHAGLAAADVLGVQVP